MKKKWTLVLMVMAWIPVFVYGQTDVSTRVFTVKLGPQFQAAQIGLHMGRIQPYAGLDYFSVEAEGTLKMTISGPNAAMTAMYKMAEIEGTLDGSVSLTIPHGGIKYYLSTQESRPYLYAGVFKAFPSLDANLKMAMESFDEAGQPIPGGSFSEKQELIPKDTKKFLEDLLGFWGIHLGFGVEWRVNKHFGLAGEYGLQLTMTQAKQKIDIESLAALLGEDAGLVPFDETNPLAPKIDAQIDVSAALRTSRVAVALNFYF